MPETAAPGELIDNAERWITALEDAVGDRTDDFCIPARMWVRYLRSCNERCRVV